MEDFTHALKVFGSVDTRTWVCCDSVHGNRKAMFQRTQLFERLNLFEYTQGEVRILAQEIHTVGIHANVMQGRDTDVFVLQGICRGVALPGDRRT